jgi:oligoendopeptidase F
MKRGDAFIAEYDKLLSSTGKNTVAEVGRLAGVDVHSIDLWRSSLKMVEQDIEKFIHM